MFYELSDWFVQEHVSILGPHEVQVVPAIVRNLSRSRSVNSTIRSSLTDLDRGNQVGKLLGNILHVLRSGQPVVVPPVEEDGSLHQGQVVVGRSAGAVHPGVGQTVPEVKATEPLGVVALSELGHGLG